MTRQIPTTQFSTWLSRIISEIPEPRPSDNPSEAFYIKKIIRDSAIKSSSVSAALAIPGGVTGFISMLPDIATVWRIQSQMISNIAAVHGKSALVTREQMLWCMFRQMAVGVFKEVVVQQGSQYLVKQASDKVFKSMLGRIGHVVIRKQGTRAVGKMIPLLGSVSAGALTYLDTMRVGKNAHHLYSSHIDLLPTSGGASLKLEK